ncbi:DNA helicase, ATP-dependent [Trema orientale]|uniref:DNA helicase, ATP-dependent n=1 Tax=Trema orientale TaxID=63057 RepID=A0A2P5F2G5_TREOI|nr:DNA helicase, ATP-dependent [Trema orientale]
MVKPSDKFHFSFEWDNAEDTSQTKILTKPSFCSDKGFVPAWTDMSKRIRTRLLISIGVRRSLRRLPRGIGGFSKRILELPLQIEKEIVKLAQYLDMKVMSVVREYSVEKQGFEFSRGQCEVLIATPGHLIDLLQWHYIILNNYNYVVLDEAD